MSSAALVSEAPPASRALAFEGVTCAFGSYVAVKDINLDVDDGEFVSIVGPTGCGKSTILNVASGLKSPTRGTIRIFDRPLKGVDPDIGYLFQAESLMPWFNALRNTMTGLLYRGVPKTDAEKIARQWMGKVGLSGFENYYPHQMSGGMRKRVSLAQTFACDPRIILMDEPFSALDIQTRQLMETELLTLWAANRRSVLFITHDLEEAIALSDRVIVLSAGPATRPIGDFRIDLPRPRDVSEIRMSPRFLHFHALIWDAMREEVMKAYSRQKGAPK